VGSAPGVLLSVIVRQYTYRMARKTTPRNRKSSRPPGPSKPRKKTRPVRATRSQKPASVAKRRVPAADRTSDVPPHALRAWTPAEVEEAFRRFEAANPEPKGELEYSSPFTLLVAVVLSAQATDVGVNKATRVLFRVADTPEKMVQLGEERLREYIKTIGLYRNKAKNVIALSRMLIDEYGGKVPDDREALERLPGVGRKSANVVLNTAFGQPTIAVDTHIFRVSNRTGLAIGKTPFEVESALEAVIPARYKLHAHHWLILQGRYICKAIKPSCDRCLISDLCQWPCKRI